MADSLDTPNTPEIAKSPKKGTRKTPAKKKAAAVPPDNTECDRVMECLTNLPGSDVVGAVLTIGTNGPYWAHP